MNIHLKITTSKLEWDKNGSIRLDGIMKIVDSSTSTFMLKSVDFIKPSMALDINWLSFNY